MYRQCAPRDQELDAADGRRCQRVAGTGLSHAATETASSLALHAVCRTFLNSAEDQLGVFAQYYGLPQLSLRDVVWHETEAGAPGFALEDIMLPNGGNIHPNERGHGCDWGRG